ncbi:MAG: oxygen-dependent coproporphyrinogen oxidase [Proteobacteria bacterium]|nr:oxygen-dependent coproporphyrinogen oxidase [Pseudomonadota bacterium]
MIAKMELALNELQKERLIGFLKESQNLFLDAFCGIDGSGDDGSILKRRCWQRNDGGGGGEMGVVRGEVVEKAGCNVSIINGKKYPGSSLCRGSKEDSDDFAEKPFFATGLSTIVHMFNPHAPIAHMNVRLFQVGQSFWFGGGADLTPFFPYSEDTEGFHSMLRSICEKHHPLGLSSYRDYSKWCDEYFYIPHRGESRGVGGIFFDRLQGDFEPLFGFICQLVKGYMKVLVEILGRRKDMPYREADKEKQLYWRARYAEFNLLYDRGTRFGLQTGGDLEAIFVSMPPAVKW